MMNKTGYGQCLQSLRGRFLGLLATGFLASGMVLLSISALMLSSASAHASTIRVAAASDLRFALPIIVSAFTAEHPDYEVNVVYGSSGRFYSQIRNGAPFHIYFSADIDYPQRLLNLAITEQQKNAHNRSVYPYAEGLLAAWTLADNFAVVTHGSGEKTLSSDNEVNVDSLAEWLQHAVQQRRGRIAIANPQHAPYGVRALEWLQQHPLWPELEGRLVFAENVAQVAHFVRSGSAQVGILALPLALSAELSEHGQFLAIPPDQHAPIIQGMLVTEYGSEHAGALAFFNFMQSSQAKEMLSAAGFLIPSQRDINGPE